MDKELANDITSTLIGFSVSFKYFEESIMINPFVNVKLSRSLYYSNSEDSYCKIGFNLFDFIPDLSFNIFDIKPRAKELGMKLKPFINDGEIFINAFENFIRIAVNVYESKVNNIKDKGSVIITIFIPPSSKRERKSFNDEDANQVKKAFSMSCVAVGGIILFKVLKGGIGAIMGGPVGAAIGFAT